ncbi:hypothetical protein J6590_079539 [Homalodisca vitripennis]|nr:hypothetical protein J6590_079539 [Homalodisca vitripennis]
MDFYLQEHTKYLVLGGVRACSVAIYTQTAGTAGGEDRCSVQFSVLSGVRACSVAIYTQTAGTSGGEDRRSASLAWSTELGEILPTLSACKSTDTPVTHSCVRPENTTCGLWAVRVPVV